MSQEIKGLVTVEKYQVAVDGVLKTFTSKADALAALRKQELMPRVDAYLDTVMVKNPETGVEEVIAGKPRVAKANVILGFLGFEEAAAQEAPATTKASK